MLHLFEPGPSLGPGSFCFEQAKGYQMKTHRHHQHYLCSLLVAEATGAEPLRCWRNAAFAVVLLPDLFSRGSYVEGWIVVPRKKVIEIIEHGWSLLPDLGIIDPSVVLIEPWNQPIFYFPGYVLSRDQLSRLLPGSTLPLVCYSYYGSDGMRHHGYRRVYQQAWQQARHLAKKMRLPRSAIKVSRKDARREVTIVVEMRNEE
jgi:hypothetical protein